jgi:hypothetical protein
MYLEENEAKNNCVGEGQQQFNQPTYQVVGCEIVANRKRRKHETRRISIVENCYLDMSSEDIKDYMCVTVRWFVECVGER